MKHALVLQSDFGLSDGAVSAMYGVANSVDGTIPIFDITHDIPPYNIWEASYRLLQTMMYWPEGTVFVSVVDPGVGTNRNSVVVQTETNQFIVTPDNGTLTHINKKIGIKKVRTIDENVNRLPKSGASHTFHGRDVYAYTGARLAAGIINYEQVGDELSLDTIVDLPFYEAYLDANQIAGIIDILDVRFGNLWTNVSRELFNKLDVEYGDTCEIIIQHETKPVYENTIIFGKSFAAISIGEPLLYINSLDNIAVAINQGSFANINKIGTGYNWKIMIRKIY
ncbi:S-adenosyl-l-methionine hydroxide adenosyltransferase family protein [Radiobacillus sp. PE A8.2]|uniref:SAM hydrolase/SAM-dependent halogenase family protein n=1 Tax=Radiobacillus sp. PE A8.2 TaxID=3380349 RepID=UPI00388E41F2